MKPEVRSHLRQSLGVAALAMGLGACAPHPTSVKVQDLNQTIASLRAQNTEYLRRIEELENQVFVLSDKVGGREAPEEPAVVAPARLPRVTLRPGDEVPGIEASETAVYSFGDEGTVEYAGDAAKPSRHRPLLRLVGDGSQVGIEGAEDRAPAAVRLAVAPPVRSPSGVAAGEPKRLAVTSSDEAPQALYRHALEHLRGGRHADAAAGFREFLRRFAKHDYADNAQYWLAECYYDLKDFVTAVREFRKVADEYPAGNKVPDALLKVGLAYVALGNEAGGRSTLRELAERYAAHPAAALAKQRVAELDGGNTEDEPGVGGVRP